MSLSEYQITTSTAETATTIGESFQVADGIAKIGDTLHAVSFGNVKSGVLKGWSKIDRTCLEFATGSCFKPSAFYLSKALAIEVCIGDRLITIRAAQRDIATALKAIDRLRNMERA